MSKIGIIVDGAGDLLSIKRRYPDQFKVLKTDGPRGHNSSTADIISKSKKQISMLKSLKCSKAIVLLDFESRRVQYQKFLKDIEKELTQHTFDIDVDIVVSNKMIENWYLADIELLSKKKAYLKDNLRQKQYEGKHGKEELKKLFKSKFSYSETEHGPQLFELIRESIAANNSKSFKIFIEKIKDKKCAVK
jgi:hypothetical protein